MLNWLALCNFVRNWHCLTVAIVRFLLCFYAIHSYSSAERYFVLFTYK